uniref:G-protein coupled receptors family 1 profile domain-containing protein n=1 Tax=Panagrellus redivivus TaxID=6233 RepID=A0A7E4VKX7_PANRE
MGFIVLIHLFLDYLFYACYNSTKSNHTFIVERAHNTTGNLLDEWLDEQSLIFIADNNGETRASFFIALVILVVVLIMFCCIGIWFIRTLIILKKTSKTLNEKSTFLLTTAIVQAGVFIVFLYIPSIVITACWSFAIENTGNVVNIALVFFCLHGTADILCTLYFVTPYRLYCISLVPAFLKKKKPMSLISLKNNIAIRVVS